MNPRVLYFSALVLKNSLFVICCQRKSHSARALSDEKNESSIIICFADVTKTGNGEWGMGNGEWGMENGEWEMGNSKMGK